MYILEVYIPNTLLKLNRTFTYCSDINVERFCRVKVNFNNRPLYGLVYGVKKTDYNLEELSQQLGYKVSMVLDVVDKKAFLNESQIELATWLAKTTISPFISCLNIMLPKTLKISNALSKAKQETYVIKLESDKPLTNRQLEIYNSLDDEMLLKDARKQSPSIINKLIDLGYLKKEERECRYVDNEVINVQPFKTLNHEQAQAYEKMIASDKMVSLLFGVTGSGKTEVYLHLARHYIDMNKEVLILVPEISLTPQMIQRVKERFLDVIFYHSNLSDNERYIQYNRIKNQEAKIVVGTRSSIFLPFNDLGLIIIDEEHDSSYKQDNTPLYNAKNVAIKLAMMHKAKVLLASATPSLESYSRALKNDYLLLTLKNRINFTPPKIEIVDLSKSLRRRHHSIISEELLNEIDRVLKARHQVIILLNRRGYSPVVKCGTCNRVIMCDDCDVALSYHKDENILKCHQCGRTYSLNKECPNCHGHNLLFYSFGTKKIEEELQKLFPDSHIARMDHDNISKQNNQEKILKSFERHEIDILIGTQMIAKGLDFPLVELVGILNADAGLMHQDYNSAKMTFDLLMQASGRSGRSDIDGKVIIEAFNPEHYVLNAVLKQDYNYFYNIEMNYRFQAKYPPYSHIVAIYISDVNPDRLEKSTMYLTKLLNGCPYRIYKATSLIKLNKLNRKRILIMDKSLIDLLNYCQKITNDYLKQNNLSNIKIDIDPNYLE